MFIKDKFVGWGPLKQEIGKRFMIIVEIKDEQMFMLPLSTFDKKMDKKLLILKNPFIFAYGHEQGNKRDGYICLNQVYITNKSEIKSKKIKTKWIMAEPIFKCLQASFNTYISRNPIERGFIKFL